MGQVLETAVSLRAVEYQTREKHIYDDIVCQCILNLFIPNMPRQAPASGLCSCAPKPSAP